MKTIKVYFLLTFLLIFSALQAQEIVEGTVNDVKTKAPLEFANVYFNGTTIGTQTDEKGYFKFTNPPVGAGKMVISYLGYQTFQFDVKIDPTKPLKLAIDLTPIENLLADVEIKSKRDKSWERTLKNFQEQFFGDSPNRGKCTIMNAWAIDFENDKDGALVATASRPIEIENRALGFRIYFDLKNFTYSKSQVRVLGTNRFEELKPADEKERKRWISNREQTFNRGSRQFFRKLFMNQFDQAGYIIYRMEQNSDWWGTNVWDRDKSFYKPNNAVSENSQLFQLNVSAHEKLLAPKMFEVIQDKVYVTVTSQNIFDRHPVTKIKVIRPVVVTDKGHINDASAIEMMGYWAAERVADMLPNEYLPENPDTTPAINAKKTMPVYQVYLQTNKPNYAAGEQIWFSAFLTEDQRPNTEPQPLYVQLFSPLGESVGEATVFTQNGRGNGYLQIIDTLSSGPYRLRAYTKFMLNTPNTIFEKEIAVLNSQQRTGVWWTTNQRKQVATDTISVALKTDKTIYSIREKITVDIQATLNDNPIRGSFSVAVQDIRKTIKSPQFLDMGSFFGEKPTAQNLDSKYPKEKNLNFVGRAWIEKQSRFLGNHNILFIFIDSTKTQTKLVTTDKNGRFELPDIDLEGLNMLVYQITDPKGKAEPNASIFFEPLFPSTKIPVMKFEKAPLADMTQTANVPWEGSQMMGSLDGINLQEVVVAEKQDIKTDPNSVGLIKLHSDATYAVNFDEKVPYTSIYDMVSQLPGVQVIGDGQGAMNILIRGIGTPNNPYAMVIVDGMTVPNGTLSMVVNPLHIRRIEMISGAQASIYGMGAGNGVIAIYTRRFKEKYNPNSDAKTVLIEGYQAPKSFPSPNYERDGKKTGADNRISIYWNPDIQTDNNGNVSFSFFAADSPSTYKIIVEGMTASGKIGHTEKIIKIE